jgi:hypothetical protein
MTRVVVFGDLLFMATLCLRTSLGRYFRKCLVRGYSTAAGYNAPKRGDKGDCLFLSPARVLSMYEFSGRWNVRRGRLFSRSKTLSRPGELIFAS